MIREARESDIHDLRDVFIEENRVHAEIAPEYVRATNDILRPDELKAFLDSETVKVFVAEKEIEVVGAILVTFRTIEESRWTKPYTIGFVEELSVREKAQRQGIGSLLIQKAENWVQSKGVEGLELHVWNLNERAIQFYESLGFTCLQRVMKLSRGKCHIDKN